MLLCGLPIESVESSIDGFADFEFSDSTIMVGIEHVLSIFVFSDSRNPTILIKTMIDEFIKFHIIQEMRSSAVYIIYLMAAVYVQDHEMAMKLIEAKAASLNLFGTYFSVLNEFFIGLASLFFAKTCRDNLKWINIANGCIDVLRKWSTSAPENILNKLTLLEAESSALSKNETHTMQLYAKAISLSKKHKFIHEEALSCEKAGIHCLECKNDCSAEQFLLGSYKAYFKWGATAKMHHLRTSYPLFSKTFDSIHPSAVPSPQVPSDLHSLLPSSACLSEISLHGSLATSDSTGKVKENHQDK